MSSNNDILLEIYKILNQITKILTDNNKIIEKNTYTNNKKVAGIHSGYHTDNTMKDWIDSLRN